MSVYVDPQFTTAVVVHWRWPSACHLFADSTVELHRFAARIGLKHVWFQYRGSGGLPHYDLNLNKRRKAVFAGAIELDRATAGAKIREIRRLPLGRAAAREN